MVLESFRKKGHIIPLNIEELFFGGAVTAGLLGRWHCFHTRHHARLPRAGMMHSIFNIMTNFIFLNDKIIPDTEGSISSADRGFLYGDGIFETFRSYDREPFKLVEHIERMRNSAKRLMITFEWARCVSLL